MDEWTRPITSVRTAIKFSQGDGEIPHSIFMHLHSGLLGDFAGLGAPIYRGHPNSEYKLVPDLYRPRTTGWFDSDFTWNVRSAAVMDMFKRHARPYLTQLPLDEWEWLALARHHGVPSPFLDWSLKPLVALWFAAKPFADSGVQVDGSIYRGIHMGASGKPDAGFQIVIPPAISTRIVAQGSIFTYHNPPSDGRLFSPLDYRESPTNFELTRAIVPADSKARIRQELSHLGVNDLAVFPDLDGLGQWIRQRFENPSLGNEPGQVPNWNPEAD